MKKVEKNDWSTLLVALSDISFADRGMINRMSLPEVLKAIKEKIGMTEDEDTLVPNDIDQQISGDVGNEWDELVLDDLDPEDRSECRELKEVIDSKRFEQFQEHYEIIKKSMTKRNRRGRPRKEKEEEQKRKQGNFRVNTKWIRRTLRTKRPIQDQEEQKAKKQKSEADQSQNAFPSQENSKDDSVLPPTSEHTSQTVEGMTSDLSLLPPNGMDQQNMASGLVESSNQRNEILVSSAPDGEKDNISEVVESSTQPEKESLVPASNPESVVDIVAPSEAPRSPGGVSQISMSSRPGPRLVWQSVFCSICNIEYGQYKYDPNPTWMYRVCDERGGFCCHCWNSSQVSTILCLYMTCSGRYFNTGSRRKRRYATLINEEGVKNWLFQNKERCRCG